MARENKSTKRVQMEFPLIRKCVSRKDFQMHTDLILDYYETLDEPLFVENNNIIEQVLLSKNYYAENGYGITTPFPDDDEIAAALANHDDESKSEGNGQSEL